MLSNDQMKANRYGKWAKARATLQRIQTTFAAGGVVMVGSYTKPMQYDKRHAAMFQVVGNSLYVQRGTKSRDCLDFSPIHFYLPK